MDLDYIAQLKLKIDAETRRDRRIVSAAISTLLVLLFLTAL